jgi:hypothetical protein
MKEVRSKIKSIYIIWNIYAMKWQCFFFFCCSVWAYWMLL